jgi:hypothetical protein
MWIRWCPSYIHFHIFKSNMDVVEYKCEEEIARIRMRRSGYFLKLVWMLITK